MDERSPKPDQKTSTEIDLGEDLLEGTGTLAQDSPGAAVEGPVRDRRGPPIASSDRALPSSAQAIPKNAIEEALQNAKILAQEGFLEDSKKILRRILLKEPRHVAARKRLEEIQNDELKTILDSREAPRVPVRWRREKDAEIEDPEAVLAQLDRDLGLGVLNSLGDRKMFSDDETLATFRATMLKVVVGKPFSAKSDLGIAMLEMGLTELALDLFESACEQSANETGAVDFGVLVLACEALLQLGRAFEVIYRMEPLVANSDIPRKRKTEPYYLLARAQQALGREEEALRCYRMAADIEPHYREVDERIRTILERKLRAK